MICKVYFKSIKTAINTNLYQNISANQYRNKVDSWCLCVSHPLQKRKDWFAEIDCRVPIKNTFFH